ncbi:hypothetical protein EV356DRAFT_498586 [Viridothelium virens]|uniref:Uncharacterized protein n=1 Tax=Viridothelium virens TaxID=1048519 RepID=A0A6A6GT46_VIRVR|nr:hypothetical protein EV356DRAFT_498586 [Viridothelium virens]
MEHRTDFHHIRVQKAAEFDIFMIICGGLPISVIPSLPYAVYPECPLRYFMIQLFKSEWLLCLVVEFIDMRPSLQ